MKIFKVCYAFGICLSDSVAVCAPDFKNDVRVFTSKQRAVDYATTSMCNLRDVLGYNVREVADGYIRSWMLNLGSTRRVIQVIEDETI